MIEKEHIVVNGRLLAYRRMNVLVVIACMFLFPNIKYYYVHFETHFVKPL